MIKELLKRRLINIIYLIPLLLVSMWFFIKPILGDFISISIIILVLTTLPLLVFRNMKIYRVWIVSHVQYDVEARDLKECNKFTIKCQSYLWPGKYDYDQGDYFSSKWDNYEDALNHSLEILNKNKEIKVEEEIYS